MTLEHRDRGVFRTGDYVRIRDWEDMADEYGTEHGDIDCMFTFTEEMRMSGLCGLEFEITGITNYGHIEGHGTDYSISSDMIEHVREDTMEDFDTEDIDIFLKSIIVN